MMITALLLLVAMLFVVMYLNGKLADDVEYLTDSKESLFRSFEIRTNQNSQLIEALLRCGISPEWDNIDKEYLFFDTNPKKTKKAVAKKVNKKKK